jgi:hypothetical protein
MINRKKLKELLEVEVKKAGSVRSAASRMKINSTSIQDYIDEITEPRGKNLELIAAYFQKHVSYFFSSAADSHIHEQTDPYGKPKERPCPFCGDMSEDIKALCKRVKDIMESGHRSAVPALLSNITAFEDSVEQAEDLRKLKEKVRHHEKLLSSDVNTGSGREAGAGMRTKKM